MSDWVLIPCLKVLFEEFDRIAPRRDHASDGSIGDTAHQNEVSDHNPDETGNVPIHDADKINEVHAIDVDNNLNANFTMEDVIQFLLAECRKNNPNGTDRGRLRYIIYNRRIWESKNNWAERAYTGASAHTEHAHFSAEYETAFENDTSTWGLVERFGEEMTDEEFITKLVKALKDSRVQAAMNTCMAYVVSNMSIYDKSQPDVQETYKLGEFIGYVPGTPGSLTLQQLSEVLGKLDALAQKLEAHFTGIVEGQAPRNV